MNKNQELYVYWYDMYGDEHKSKVYAIDWVDTDYCKIVTK